METPALARALTDTEIDRLEKRIPSDREAVRKQVERHLEDRELPPRHRARLEILMARIHHERGEHGDALRLCRRTLEWAIGANERLLAGKAYNLLGLIYWRMGDLAQAMEAFAAAVQEAQTVGEPQLELRASANLGIIHCGQKQWTEAERIYRRSMVLAEPLNDPGINSVNAHNLACVLWERDGATDEALELNREAHRCKLPLGDPISLSHTMNNMVGMLRDRGDYAGALEALEESARWVAAADTVRTDYFLELNRGQFHLAMDNPYRDDRLGFEELDAAIRIAEGADLVDEQARALESLAKAYADRGNHEKAYAHLTEHNKLRERYLTEQTAQKIEHLRSAFEIQRLEREHRIERKRREEVEALNARLRELGREKDSLLRLLGHDLRSHVGGMIGMADLIMGAVDPEHEVAEYAGDILTAGRSTLQLLDEILEHGSALEGAFSERAPVDLVAATRESVKRLENLFINKGQPLTLTTSTSTALVATNRPGFQRVLENLISNASKFSPRGRPVTVLVEQGATWSQVAVVDHGQGVPAHEISRLFSAAHKISVRPTDGESTSGIGLVLAREIAEKIGARLSHEPTPGGGATFVLRWDMLKV